MSVQSSVVESIEHLLRTANSGATLLNADTDSLTRPVNTQLVYMLSVFSVLAAVA